MSRRCELTGKGPMVKNLISHSHILTKKWMKPNLQKRRMWSDTLNAFVTLRVTTSALRSVDHVGGFDRFITRQADELLSKRALAFKARILAKRKAG